MDEGILIQLNYRRSWKRFNLLKFLDFSDLIFSIKGTLLS